MSDHWILIFSYFFPPDEAIGGLRPFRFYKYLPQHGFKCHVITAADVRPDLQAERVRDPFELNGSRGLAGHTERAVRKFVLPGWINLQWSRDAFRAAERFLRKHQNDQVTVFSTSPPLGPHLAAWRLVTKHKLPWIVDFRDPLTGNPSHTGLPAHSRATFRWLENQFVAASGCVIANTDGAQRLLCEQHPKNAGKIRLLWNGFDPAEGLSALSSPPRPFRKFVHVGELYGGRTIAPIIESVSRLVAAGRLDPSCIQFHFAGETIPSSLPGAELLRQAESKGWLKLIREHIPKTQAQETIGTADGLLIIQPQSAVQVPAKLFEYAQIGRPILALVPENSAIERILKQSELVHRCVYVNSPAEQFDAALLDYFSFKNEVKKAGSWFESTFNVERQTQTLAEFIGATQNGNRR